MTMSGSYFSLPPCFTVYLTTVKPSKKFPQTCVSVSNFQVLTDVWSSATSSVTNFRSSESTGSPKHNCNPKFNLKTLC